jgi:acyl-CoA dehydrogenase
MSDRTFLTWPFFDDAHRQLAARFEEWVAREIEPLVEGEHELDETCREYVRRLGDGGWLRHAVPAPYGASARVDVRTLCLIRETLARSSALADFAFALQGLGSGPISFYGSDEQKRKYLAPVAAGERVAAFALSEPDAGSDVAAMQTTARRSADGYVLNGTKTWISNAGIADHYIVFCRMEEGHGEAEPRFSAFVVDADTRGLRVSERIEVTGPHPLGTVELHDCFVRSAQRIGEEGLGMRMALGTLDAFRPSVGAAALGMARRALDEALRWSAERYTFGKPLGEHQLTQARLGEMATEIDASALLVYRAAWTRDQGAPRIPREAAMAKMYATEAAQRVIDSAVQLLGARGVRVGGTAERLYREIRALRIYEGTTEIQKLIIGGQVYATTDE